MTTRQLAERYCGSEPAGYGHYRVRFMYRGEIISAVTTNIDAVDRIRFRDNYDDRQRSNESGPTLKEAYDGLYYEVVRKVTKLRKELSK